MKPDTTDINFAIYVHYTVRFIFQHNNALKNIGQYVLYISNYRYDGKH